MSNIVVAEPNKDKNNKKIEYDILTGRMPSQMFALTLVALEIN